jgi:hypothetical protein
LYNEQLRRTAPENKNQYTVTITTDATTAEAIYAEFNAYLQKVEKLVKNSKAQGVFQLSFDFFRWDSPGKSGELDQVKTERNPHTSSLRGEKAQNYGF